MRAVYSKDVAIREECCTSSSRCALARKVCALFTAAPADADSAWDYGPGPLQCVSRPPVPDAQSYPHSAACSRSAAFSASQPPFPARPPYLVCRPHSCWSPVNCARHRSGYCTWHCTGQHPGRRAPRKHVVAHTCRAQKHGTPILLRVVWRHVGASRRYSARGPTLAAAPGRDATACCSATAPNPEHVLGHGPAGTRLQALPRRQAALCRNTPGATGSLLRRHTLSHVRTPQRHFRAQRSVSVQQHASSVTCW